MDVVHTDKLTKRYGKFEALRDLDMRVGSGQLFGFLGPNGAGKTTAIRLLLGLLRASHGHARLFDGDAWRDGPRLRAEVGYLPGDVHFYDRLTGRATLDFLKAARGGRGADEQLRLTRRFELDLARRVGQYSRGMKQKLGLIAALFHRPRLLILDEPTTALDPLVREALYEELRAVAADGRTVLFSSHTLAEVEALCDEVAILRDGRLIEQERMGVLRERAVRHVDLRLRTPGMPASVPAGLTVSEHNGVHVRAVWRGPTHTLIEWLAELRVDDVNIAPPDLEDLFLAYYRPAKPETPA